MTPADIIAVLEQQFGDRIKSKNLDGHRPVRRGRRRPICWTCAGS